MTTNFYLDRRGDGTPQVKIALNHRGTSTYISTGIRIPEDAWDAKAQSVKKAYPNASRLNIALSTKKLDVDTAIEELRKGGRLKGLSLSQMRKAIMEYLSPERAADASSLFMARLIRYRDTKKKYKTWETYDSTAKKVRAFDNRADRLTFEDITYGWLVRFDDFLSETSPSANARSIKFRCIKAVFNEAINDGITTSYPFRRFKVRPQATKSRALTRDQLRALFDFDCDAAQRPYLDIFKLSFFLAGINIVDLVSLKKIENGRIECRRAKTGERISVRVEPEALDIINKYRGTDWLLNIRDRYTNYRDYLKRMNTALKRIGIKYDAHTKTSQGAALFPDITSYYARYSWVNIGAELDIPNEVLDAGIAHKTKGIISVYLRLNYNRKVDEANRKIIDYVLNDN